MRRDTHTHTCTDTHTHMLQGDTTQVSGKLREEGFFAHSEDPSLRTITTQGPHILCPHPAKQSITEHRVLGR